MTPSNGLFVLLLGLVACLYAAVGHAGATGYIAVMSLAGIAPQTIRPVALMLNVLVGGIATLQFARAGYFSRRIFLPLAAASLPAATVGGWLQMPATLFEAVVGAVLLFSAGRIFAEWKAAGAGAGAEDPQSPSAGLLLALGSGLGFLSGLTGVGGGVFLTPALLAMKAAPIKAVAAVSAAFILVNSMAGLIGWLAAGNTLPAVGLSLVAAVVCGGVVGAQLGAFSMQARTLRLLMAVVLLVAGLKLLMKGLAG
jgi:uncharacterized membrane protein YfcA